MNIGILTPLANPKDPSSSTAQYRYILDLTRLLSESHDITLYPVSKHKWSLSLPFRARVVPICSTNPLVRLLKTLTRLTADCDRIDLFIAFNPNVLASPVILLKKLYRKPVIVDYGDEQSTAAEHYPRTLRFLNMLIENLCLRTIDNWIIHSSYHERKIKESRKGAAILLNRSVFYEPRDPTGGEEELPVAIQSDYVNIAYMGGLHYDRGVDILIKAFSQLPLERVWLYVTGVGPRKAELERLAEEERLQNVTFICLDLQVVHKFMSMMDILVIPHRKIGKSITNFSGKSVDYTWAGKAIIVTNVGEAVHIFEHGKNAVLIEPDNVDALREALMDLIVDSEKRARLGINARRYFDENFSKDAVRDRLTKFLRDVIAASKR